MSSQQHLLDGLSVEHLQADLRGHSVRGGLLTLTSQGAQFLLQSGATVLLARLLTPSDFGLVAMVSAVTVLAQSFADLGLSEATIQRKEITHAQVSALFWINAAVGLSLTLITASLAPVLAKFYREPQLVDIALVFSLTFVICGLRVQPDALLKRQMRFSSLAIRDVGSSALAVLIAIVMACRGFGYWAIVAIPLTLNITQMAVSWLMVDWRPSLPRRNAHVGSMVAFGGHVAASYLIFNLNRNSDNVLIGWYSGARPLGLYSRAYSLLMLPVRQLSGPISGVAIPAFSKLQADPERFARYYLRTVNLVMWISAPILGFLFVAAAPVVVLTLGNQWRDAAPVFQILAISALGQLFLDSTIWLLVSRGESKRLFKMMLVIFPIIFTSFLIGLPFGIKGVALSGSLVLIAILPWILKFTFRDTNLTLSRVGSALLYPISTCFAGIFFAEVALRLIVPRHVLGQLLVTALGFAAAYLFSALLPRVREEIGSLRKLLSELRQ